MCLFILLPVLSIVIVSCGTQTTPFLAPPSGIQDDPTIGQVSFRHPSQNDTDLFLGYEVYYKFFHTGQVPELLSQDRNAIETSPVRPDPSRLTARGFRRLRLPRGQFSQDRPQAPIPRSNTGDRVTLRFIDYDTPDFQPTISWPGDPPRELRRNTVDSTDEFKRFLDANEYELADADISATVWNALEGTEKLVIAFYGLAFGRTPDLNFFYSEPVFLADFEMTNLTF